MNKAPRGKTAEDLVTKQFFSELYLQMLPGPHHEDRKLQNVLSAGSWEGSHPVGMAGDLCCLQGLVLIRLYLSRSLPSMIFSEPTLPPERDVFNSGPFQSPCHTQGRNI